MSMFKDFFKKMAERGQLLKAYWNKSPTTKIVVINTGVYVSIVTCSWCGKWDSSLKILWSNTSPANASIFQRGDFTLSSLTPSHTWASSVLVVQNKCSVRSPYGWLNGQSDSRSWKQVHLLALWPWYCHGGNYWISLPETISLYSATSRVRECNCRLPDLLSNVESSSPILLVLLPSASLDVSSPSGFLLPGFGPSEEILFGNYSWVNCVSDEKSQFFMISLSL